jgi:hypothetical protein
MSISKILQNTPPILVLGGALLTGVALALGSTIVHANSAFFAITPPKQLGYYYEINWSLNYVLFVPLALYFFFSSFSALRTTIRDLADSKMIIRADGTALAQDELQSDWQKVNGRAVAVALVLSVIAFIASWVEWWINFNYKLGKMTEVLNSTGLGPGWNLAPLVNPPYQIAPVKAFGFFAYTMQGAFASAYLGFLCVIFAFVFWISRFTTDATTSELIPQATSEDVRRGFENFESLIETLLLASLSCFGVFLLTRLDHAFLVSPALDLSGFVQQDLWWGFIHGFKDLVKGSPSLFVTGPFGYSVEMTGIGLVLSLVVCFFVPVVILRQAARESRRRLEMRNPDSKTRSALSSMVFWPLKYPAPLQLLGFLFLAACCFIFYKLTLVLVGATLIAVITKFAKSLSDSR